MIDATQELPISRQAQLLAISRSNLYYLPQQTSEADLALMRRIDELHLNFPFAGSRMLRDMLKLEGHRVGREHVRTLMAKMGIHALYRGRNTSAPIRRRRKRVRRFGGSRGSESEKRRRLCKFESIAAPQPSCRVENSILKQSGLKK